ncbi:33040_t:CDS:2, partial [Gigaspora margarita]
MHKYKQNDKWHRFIRFNINEIDLSLLKKLFIGELIEDEDQSICTSIVSQNISSCPFVALICIGIHNYPPPPPEKIPANIKNTLQALIKQAINDNEALTAHSFITETSNLHILKIEEQKIKLQEQAIVIREKE